MAEASKSSTNTANVYDSIYRKIPHDTKFLIGQYHQGDKVRINIMHVQQQENDSDCGVFAIAFAKALLNRKDPTDFLHRLKDTTI